MRVAVFDSPDLANEAAANVLIDWLTAQDTRNVMVAAGNTPLDLYERVGERNAALPHLNIFALDEYVGVPLDEPRNCANLMKRTVVEAWSIPPQQFFRVSSLEQDALASVLAHEERINESGGLDVIVLGLGQNGHLGFNEPGSDKTTPARMLDLEPISIDANRKWFGGDYAPDKGVTVGMPIILSARHAMILAFGSHKADAVHAMVSGPQNAVCPASFLQGHPDVHVFLDRLAASKLQHDT